MSRVLEGVQGRSADVSAEDGLEEAGQAGQLGDTAVGSTGDTVTEPAVEVSPAAAVDVAAEGKVRAARLALFAEKLKESRERRAAQRLQEKAREDRRAASVERRAVADEKAKYASLKEGSFKDTLAALGMDPRKAYEEMSREAIESGTPEALLRRAQADFEKRFTEQQARIDALEKERQEALAERTEREHSASIRQHFMAAASAQEFRELRIEYPDEVLVEHARYYDKHPQELHRHANDYGIQLTNPAKGFTMHELLQVLSAAQAAHNTSKQARLAAMSPSSEATKLHTVNGTSERRNAGSITNDIAAQRASTGPTVSGSARDRLRQRIEAEVRRSKV